MLKVVLSCRSLRSLKSLLAGWLFCYAHEFHPSYCATLYLYEEASNIGTKRHLHIAEGKNRNERGSLLLGSFTKRIYENFAPRSVSAPLKELFESWWLSANGKERTGKNTYYFRIK